MKEIILFKVSVTTPRWIPIGAREGFGGYKPDEIGM